MHFPSEAAKEKSGRFAGRSMISTVDEAKGV